MSNLIYKNLSYKVVGILYDTHNELGRYCTERQYGDLLEKILKEKGLSFKRELAIEVAGKKSSFADFLIENVLILELKSKPILNKEDYYQVKRYLETLNKELAILVNFRNKYLSPKRILNPNIKY